MSCRLPTSSRGTAAEHGSDSRAGLADATPPGVANAAVGGGVSRVSPWGSAVSVHAVSTNAISSVGTDGLISGCYCCRARGSVAGASHARNLVEPAPAGHTVRVKRREHPQD